MEDFSHSFRRNQNSATLSKKISNENGFSAKTVYDDVFGGPPKFGVPTFSSRVEDYSEIFGGFHSSKRSSIPILDLPEVDERDVFLDVRSSRFDYSEVFGGSADVDFAIPYEDLFAEPKGLETSSEEAWTPAETGSPSEGSIEDPFPCTDKSQCLSNGTSHRSLDGTKQFNISYHKKIQRSKEDGTTHITQFPAVPGFSIVVDESTPLQETEADKSLRPITNGCNVSIDFSGGILENSYIKKTASQPPISSAVKSDIKPEKGAGVNRSYRNESFVTVSEINLRTNPSQVPAPSRPPPKLAVKKGISKKFVASDLKASDSFSHESSAGDVSPPFFDVEVDASSSAAASAAAMKEAMVKAEARLKYAKEFMQRNDSLQSMKLRLKDDLKGKEKKEVKAAQFGEETKETFEQKDNKVKGFAKEESQKVMRVAQGTLDSEEGGRILTSAEESAEKKHRRESRSIQESYKQEERVGEWIAEKQFYELVNTESFRTVPDTFGQAKNEKKMMTTMRPDEHEQNEKKAATNTSFGWQEESDTKLKEVKEPLKLKENKWKPMAAKETDKWEAYEKKLNEAQEEKQVEVAHEDGKREEKLNEAIEREHDWKIKESYKQKEIERKLKEASELEESEKKIKEAREQEENKRKQKEAFEKEEAKKRLIETYEQEENEKKRKEILEREENEKRLKEANEQIENEKRQIEIRQREENEKRLKEDREENERRLREANEQVENEKRLQEAREQAENVKRQIEIRQREENEKRLKDAREENERRLREANERLENEKRLEEAREQAENEKRQIEIRQREENEKRLKEAREENERRLREAREQEEIEKHRKEVAEKEENEKRQKEARELEENEKRQKDACEREENIKRLKKALEREENEKRQKEARDMEENEKRKQDAFDREENEKRVKEAVKLEECEQQLNETHEQEEKSRQKETCDWEASNIKLKGTQDADEHKEESIKAACKSEKQEDNKVFKAIQEAAKHEKNRKTMKVGGCECGESEKEFQETTVANEQVESERVGVSHVAQSALENEEDGKRRKNDTDDREKKLGEPQLEMPQMTSQLEENGKNIKEAQVAFDCEENRIKVKAAQPVKQWVEYGKKMETAVLTNALDDKSNKLEIAKDAEKHQGTERREKKPIETLTVEDTVKDQMQGERKHEMELLRKIEEECVREKEREKDRMVVERATREARERAERAAVERATAEARQRALAEARERLEKASAEAREKSLAEKASNEARLRVERAAVERATAEARERAAEKAALQASKRAERSVSEKYSSTSRDGGMRHTSSFSDLRDSQFQSSSSSSSSHLRYPNSSNRGASYNTEKFQVSEGESAQRCKARLERHQRAVERAAKALAEKNMRDLLAQREQTERNRLSETLDADVRRWSSGKEGNLRALLSTLQYILGPDSGWQPIPLTEVITAVAVKKAYRKATLCVHPDKLQQRGASIQQKYICEKVFDLLKEAWNKFNSEER